MDILDFELPPELIAQTPSERREGSRLLCLDRAREGVTHHRFHELVGFLRPGDLLVLNDTAVFPARLRGVRADTGGKVEVLLLEPRAGGEWTALLKCGGKPRPGERLSLSEGALRPRLIERLGEGQVLLAFDEPELDAKLDAHGELPLPPYIDAEVGGAALHRERYQTVFAARRGAVAAPTAGLHFSEALLAQIRSRGVSICSLTLHVGLGTFMPIRGALSEHVMHAERYEIPAETAATVAATRAAGGRVIACGTTSVRTLESFARTGALSGDTRLFIKPPWEFRLVDALLTNFHLPQTTLLLLVAALAGEDRLRAAYTEALRERYRFYSYGDAMLIC